MVKGGRRGVDWEAMGAAVVLLLVLALLVVVGLGLAVMVGVWLGGL